MHGEGEQAGDIREWQATEGFQLPLKITPSRRYAETDPGALPCAQELASHPRNLQGGSQRPEPGFPCLAAASICWLSASGRVS
jgi:hypothetical protein